MPVVFVTGSADPYARLSEVTAMFQRVQSHAKLIVFNGAGHQPLDRYDQPLFRATILKLLEPARHTNPPVATRKRVPRGLGATPPSSKSLNPQIPKSLYQGAPP